MQPSADIGDHNGLIIRLTTADNRRQHRDVMLRLQRQRSPGAQMLLVPPRTRIVGGEETRRPVSITQLTKKGGAG